MKRVWLTYAWVDNEDNDIDFIIQELDKKPELAVKFDRRNLIPGQRLWAQIGGIITDPNECDAWGIVLTANSIQSQACIEELSYALDRALGTKGSEFPVFAMLHKVNPREMPPVLKIRLSIHLNNKNWVEQVVAAANQVPTGFVPSNISQFIVSEGKIADGVSYLEIRPRFDRISPFVLAVDLEEKNSGNVFDFMAGPANRPPGSGVLFNVRKGESTLSDGTHIYFYKADNEASSTTSYFLLFKTCPKRVWFGDDSNLQLYTPN